MRLQVGRTVEVSLLTSPIDNHDRYQQWQRAQNELIIHYTYKSTQLVKRASDTTSSWSFYTTKTTHQPQMMIFLGTVQFAAQINALLETGMYA